MAKVNNATINVLIYRGCAIMEWEPWYLSEDEKLFAAEIAVDDLIESVGEDTPTGQMWQRYERAIIRLRTRR